MAQFAKAGFDAAAYLACRPVYPRSLVAFICQRLASSKTSSQFQSALDLGCGPGQLSVLLAERFERVYGVDPSIGMIENAIQPEEGHVTYTTGSAEDLSAFGDETMDLITAAQAAHWFDHQKVYPQLARILKPGGMVCYIGYGEMYFPNHPELQQLCTTEYGRGKLKGYWDAGREHVEACYDTIPFPLPTSSNQWDLGSFTRTKFDQGMGAPTPSDVEAEHLPTMMTMKWDVQALSGYFKTWSAVHKYNEVHGTDQDGKSIENRFLADFREQVGQSRDSIEVAFPLTVMCMWKKS